MNWLLKKEKIILNIKDKSGAHIFTPWNSTCTELLMQLLGIGIGPILNYLDAIFMRY